MDSGFHTPLLDFFRRGEVASDVRLLAARGALAPRAHEQLALLLILIDDGDSTVAHAAAATIARIPLAPLRAFLARSDVPAEMREFFAARGVQPADRPADAAEDPLLDTEPESEEDRRRGEVLTPARLALLGIVDKIRVAMKGSRESRTVLIRDPNRLVSAAVLSSPKLTEHEVENYAKMANLSEEVLRIIGTTRNWMKNYSIASGLARNPKTPLAISLHLLGRLHDRDLKMISIDRNVPEPLRIAARKRVVNEVSRR